MRLGVDLGTTWTAAAIHGDGDCEAVQLAQHTIAMPSVVAVADGAIVAGDAAERRMATDPASAAREFKRRLGDSTPYVLDGTPYGAEALMGHLLRHVVEAATKQAGAAPSVVTLTHPANWGEFKLDLLREAARIAGVESIELMPEPEAAARHYANLGRLQPGQAVAVFDFGGGTFDAAVVRLGPDGPELLGTPEGLERLGGIDLDHAVMAHVNSTLDGQLSELDTADPAVRSALARLRTECTAAKEALSGDTETAIHVAVPGHETQIRIARPELEQVLRQRMDDMLGALGRAVSSSGLTMSDLNGVLLVGGSSRIPAVAELVAAGTGLPTLIDADPKLVVAAGAAWPRDFAAGNAAAGAAAAEGASGATGAAAGATRPSATAGAKSAGGRREVLRKALALGGMTAAAGAAVVGGYAAYRSWWDGDGEVEAAGFGDAPDEVAAGLLGALFDDSLNESVGGPDSMDAFEVSDAFAPPGMGGPVPGAAPFAAPMGPPAAGPSFAPPPPPPPHRGSSAPPRPRQHHEPDRPSRPDRPDRPEHSRPDHDGAPPMPPPVATAELDTVRTQLRDRVAKLELPDGTDPKDAAQLRQDLEGLVDRFRSSPGQSVDDAIAALRYEFEDRVRDFAQDQRIDALIEEQREDDQAAGMPPKDPTGMDTSTTTTGMGTDGMGTSGTTTDTTTTGTTTTSTTTTDTSPSTTDTTGTTTTDTTTWPTDTTDTTASTTDTTGTTTTDTTTWPTDTTDTTASTTDTTTTDTTTTDTTMSMTDTSTTNTTTDGLADVFDDGGAPNQWATTTASDLGATSTPAPSDVDMPGPKQVPTGEAGAMAADAMGGDVLGTGAVQADMGTATDPLIPTAPDADGGEPMNTGIVPPWLQGGADTAADEPMNTGIVPPAIDADQPDADPVAMPDLPDTSDDSMDTDSNEPEMDPVGDPLGV